MSELKITGNPTPVVGKEEFYSVNQLLANSIPTKNLDGSKPNPFEYPVEWSVHILENGKWRKTKENDKKGIKVTYKFIQQSLERKGIRILAKRGDQVARLDVKPHKAESPKIDSIEFLDKNGKKPTKPFAYGQTLKARVHCLHMENRRVYATLWEDDAAGAGHNKANEKNKMKTLHGTVKGGIADIDFVLEPDFAKIANAIKAKGDSSEGKTHEYYVTAEILNKKTASKNTNVANPDDKVTKAKPATPPKPAAPKKQTPAQKKGPSKKQKKEKSIGDDVIDWWEGLFKVKPIIVPNPQAPTGNNPLKTGEADKNPKEDKKEGPNCGEKFCIKKGDKSELIREINIRLAGFGGNVPTDEFTDRTEKMIKQFQRDYMKVPETGKVCGNVLKAVDEFCNKWVEKISDYTCLCKNVHSITNKCSGFGKGRYNGEYSSSSKIERYHKYERPGIHRALLWGTSTLRFYLSKQDVYKYLWKTAGYRCWEHNNSVPRTSTNHMGKAVDIQFSKNGITIGGKRESNLPLLRDINDKFYSKYLNAKYQWVNGKNNFSIEPIGLGTNQTYSWIHLDVREFDNEYLDDKYFVKTQEKITNGSISELAKKLGFLNTCMCNSGGNNSDTKPQEDAENDKRIDPKKLKASSKAKLFIKDWEAFKPNLYNDDSEDHHCTIGYGHLVHSGPCNGSEPQEFKNGISKERGLQLFDLRIADFEKAVQRDITVPLYQYEFDALVSFLFNCGENFFVLKKAPKLYKHLLNKEYDDAAKEFLDVTSGGLGGLVKRRKAENNMFLNNIYDSNH
ncbi:hypothetical protein FNW52_09235 [Flavobacterium sp. ZT3R18]|uniref:glycoside hydrolase family protein n=1 Tax=Flavobacterium sp. ZT3R18 TaxID=2594429 RepID=UPI00117A0011|nr:glycoside hydrolase family protein [Flavobacterium sp. ZT3R18]TRX36198.1 hypothetical protein FNW52_09235 [Flavobacterium sp. ZT3R18]